MSDAPLKEKPLNGSAWTKPWHNYFDGLNRWVTGLISAIKFTDLTDTPNTYTGQAGKSVKVNVGEDGLEFFTPSSGVSDHTLLTNIGTSTHPQLDTERTASISHRADSTIHFTEGSIDHTAISNIGTNTHAQLDTEKTSSEAHRANALIHFEKADIDHTAINNIGTYTHAQIDSHIDNISNPHSVTANQVLPSQAGNAGKFLTTDATNTSWATVTAGVSGSGTTNTIPLWTAGTTLGDSALTQSAGNVTCSGDFAVSSSKVYKIGTESVLDITGTRVLRVGNSGTNTGSNCLFSGRDIAPSNPNNWNIYSGVLIGNNTPSSIGNGYNVGFGGNLFNALTTGSSNTAMGISVFLSLTSGSYNFGAGFSVGSNLTTGNDNCLMGTSVASSLATGSYNTAFGTSSLFSLQSGSGNIGLGFSSLKNLITGSYSVGIGYQSGFFSTGTENAFIGMLSGSSITTGDENACIGSRTMWNPTAGFSTVHRSVAIGAYAGSDSTVSDCVYIGYQAGTGNTRASTLFIANRSTSTPLIKGEFDNKYLKINGGLGTAVSIKTADYTVLPGDYHITLDGTSAGVEITLPASPNTGQEFNFACIDDTNLCEINPNGKNIYSSSANFAIYAGENLKIKYDGTRWVGA